MSRHLIVDSHQAAQMRCALRRLEFAAVLIVGLAVLTTASVCPAATVIVDNVDAGFSVLPGGAWSTFSASGQYGDDYAWKDTDDVPAGEVEWRPTIGEAGYYQVAVWYRSTGSGRPDNAHYTVYHAGGTSDVYVNQQENGSQWVILGTYEFAAGTSGAVTLTSEAQAGKNIVADACRFASLIPEFRGFWADAFHSGFKSESQIDDMVSRASAGNYNAIVAEILAYKDTSGGGHGAYWHSSIVPWASEVTSGFDPLEYLCDRAHASGIEVHAWLVAYRVSTSWPPSGNTTISAHPEWIMVPIGSMGGGPATVEGKYVLDPGSPDVQEYLISIVQELVNNYEIDGINWDYIRYTDDNAGTRPTRAMRSRAWPASRRLPATSARPPMKGSLRGTTLDDVKSTNSSAGPGRKSPPSPAIRASRCGTRPI